MSHLTSPGTYQNDSVTTYDYNTAGSPTDIQTQSLSITTHFHETAIAYDSTELNPTTITETYDPGDGGSNIQTIRRYTYDPNNRLLSTTEPIDNTRTVTSSYIYNGNGQLETVSRTPSGGTSTLVAQYSYKADNSLDYVEELLHDGTTLVPTAYYHFDNLGRMIQEDVVTVQGSSPTIKSSYFTYDTGNHIIQVTHPDNNYLTFGYSCCLLNDQTDENGNKVIYTYDSEGRVLSEKHGSSTTTLEETDYEYDITGHLSKVKAVSCFNPLTYQTTAYTYDNEGRLTRTDYPDGRYDLYTYAYGAPPSYPNPSDSDCFNVTLTEHSGGSTKVSVNSYDSLGRQIQTVYPSEGGTYPRRAVTTYRGDGSILRSEEHGIRTL